MEPYRTETVIQSDRVLTLHDVPFRYTAPFDSVAENEWEASR